MSYSDLQQVAGATFKRLTGVPQEIFKNKLLHQLLESAKIKNKKNLVEIKSCVPLHPQSIATFPKKGGSS
jgi:hypothetical protein